MRWSLGMGFLVPLASCTSVLGDFTVGTVSGDGSVNDVATLDVDAADGNNVVAPLKCTDQAGSAMQVTTGMALHPDLLRIASLGGGVRIVLADYQQSDGGTQVVFQSYTASHNMSGFTMAPLVTPGFNAQAIERYAVGTESGFVALWLQASTSPDGGGSNDIYAATFPDSQAGWNAPVRLFSVEATGYFQADIDVINPDTNDFFVVTTSLNGASQVFMGGEFKSGSASVGMIGTFPLMSGIPSFGLVQPGIAWRNGTASIMLQANGNAGPPPVQAPIAILMSNGQQPMLITPPSNLNYFPMGWTDAHDPSTVNTAFLIANLSTLTGNYGIGQVPSSGIASLNPTKLASTVPTAADGGVPQLTDLFITGATTHWETVNLLEQLIVVAPTTNPVTQSVPGGINLAWWDATGAPLHTYTAGDNRVFKNVFALGADATVLTFVGSIATLAMVWSQVPTAPTQQHQTPPPAADLWMGTVGCLKN